MQNDLTLADFGWPSQFIRSGASTLRVLVQGAGPAIVIVASYGRDGGADFDDIANALVKAGYLVLRPQPRGVFGFTGPMHHVTLDDFAKDVAEVIDTLGGGRAIVIGHAFGALVTKNAAARYPDKIPAIAVASTSAPGVSPEIANQPFIAGDTSLPTAERLAALELA